MGKDRSLKAANKPFSYLLINHIIQLAAITAPTNKTQQ